MLKTLIWMAVLAASCFDASAVMKCTVNSNLDANCPEGYTEARNEEPIVASANVLSQVSGRSSSLETEAEMCFAWYREHVPLEPEAKYLSFSKDGRVLTIIISIPFTFVNPAGVSIKSTMETPASCEIHNDQLDEGWTRVHAKRGNWIW